MSDTNTAAMHGMNSNTRRDSSIISRESENNLDPHRSNNQSIAYYFHTSKQGYSQNNHDSKTPIERPNTLITDQLTLALDENTRRSFPGGLPYGHDDKDW